jgi:hypothetical protein
VSNTAYRITVYCLLPEKSGELIQETSSSRPMSPIRHSRKAGAPAAILQQVPHLGLMWGSDQDDRSFVDFEYCQSRRDVLVRRRITRHAHL